MSGRSVGAFLLLCAAGCVSVPQPERTFVPIAKPEQPLERLLSDLQSLSPATRANAAWALAGVGHTDPTTMDALRNAYSDTDERVREGAAWALGHLTAGTKAPLFDEPPRPIRMPRPNYPQEAFDSKIQGTVLVDILISSSGAVIHAEIRDSIPGLDAAALRCVKQWLFTPARLNGRPVPALALAPVGFGIR